MRRYELVSGVIFALVALAQLTRAVLGWPLQIDSFSVPIWCSGVAFVIAGALAVWGFRSGGSGPAAV
jgi:hypothetical protein